MRTTNGQDGVSQSFVRPGNGVFLLLRTTPPPSLKLPVLIYSLDSLVKAVCDLQAAYPSAVTSIPLVPPTKAPLGTKYNVWKKHDHLFYSSHQWLEK